MGKLSIPDWFFPELKIVFSLSWTMTVISLFANLMGPISIMFCGHLGTKELDGVALANTLINMSGTSVIAGLATACDTLFSQSFGSSNIKMVGVYLQQVLLVFALFLFPCWAFQINAESVLIAIGQDREIAKIAGRYMLIFTPGLIALFLQTILLRYLRTQNIVWPTIIIGGIGVAINAIAHYILIYVLEMGTDGSAIAQVIAFYSIAIGCLLYIIVFKKYEPTWGGWSVDAFQDWGVLLKLATSGVIMLFVEFFSLEVGTVLAGLLGPVQLAVQSIVLQLEIMLFMIPLGVGVAVNIRVGHLIGGGYAEQAKRTIKTAYILGCSLMIVVSLLLFSLRTEVGNIFTSDQDVIEQLSELLMITSLFVILDGGACVGQGVLRGCGRQVIIACVVFGAFYVIGLPIGIPLMFLTPLENAGFWWGLTIALFFDCQGLALIIYRTDWDHMVEMAKVRTRTDFEMKDDEEKRALLSNDANDISKAGRRRQISYCSKSVSSLDLTKRPPKARREPVGPGLLFKRSIFSLLMIMTLALGIFIRFHFYYPDERKMALLCIPADNSTHTNTTTQGSYNLPFCNETIPIL